MARLPKSLIKKYGISKRAWAEFRKTKKSKSTNRGLKTMAKRKSGTKRKSYKAKSGSLKSVSKILVGAGLAALYEVFVSPMIPLARNIKNLLEILIGVFLVMQPNAYMKSAGVALITINAFEIIVPLIRGVKSKSAIGGNSSVDTLLQ